MCLDSHYSLVPLSYAHHHLFGSVTQLIISLSILDSIPLYQCLSWCMPFCVFVSLMVLVPCGSVSFTSLVPPWAIECMFRQRVRSDARTGFEPQSTGQEPSALTTRPPRLLENSSIIDALYLGSQRARLSFVLDASSKIQFESRLRSQIEAVAS